MAHEYKPGQRIRLTLYVRDGGHRPGDRGIVLSGDRATECGVWLSYYVRMEGQPAGAWTRFSAEEIEPDQGPDAAALPGNAPRVALATARFLGGGERADEQSTQAR